MKILCSLFFYGIILSPILAESLNLNNLTEIKEQEPVVYQEILLLSDKYPGLKHEINDLTEQYYVNSIEASELAYYASKDSHFDTAEMQKKYPGIFSFSRYLGVTMVNGRIAVLARSLRGLRQVVNFIQEAETPPGNIDNGFDFWNTTASDYDHPHSVKLIHRNGKTYLKVTVSIRKLLEDRYPHRVIELNKLADDAKSWVLVKNLRFEVKPGEKAPDQDSDDFLFQN